MEDSINPNFLHLLPELDPSQDGNNEGETERLGFAVHAHGQRRDHRPLPVLEPHGHVDYQWLLQTSCNMTDDGSHYYYWGDWRSNGMTGPRRDPMDPDMSLQPLSSSTTAPSDLDDQWTQLPQLPDKNPSTGTFIVDDYGDGEFFPDLPSDSITSLQHLSQTWWNDPFANRVLPGIPLQWPDSPPTAAAMDGLELGNRVTSYETTFSQDESESPSGPEEGYQMLDSAGSGSPDYISAFADRQVKEEGGSPPMEWSHSPSVESSPDRPWESFPPRAPRSTRPRPRPGPGGRRRRSKNATVVKNDPPAHWSKPLRIVHEDGRGGSISSEDVLHQPRGARRKGPLTTVGRANAGLRRKNKDTCVQCRLNKRKCTGKSPCDACFPTLQEQPCARACFANIVEYGTCNYISQRAINHPTVSGSGRVRMEIPSAFQLNDLLLLLNERRGKFNIRARQSWGSLYVLDLAETYKFLKGLSESNGPAQFTFLEFIDHRIIESKDKSKWLDCVGDCNPMSNAYALLSRWNNMPSRAAYSYVFLEDGAQEQPMDVTKPEDQKEILLAAQLSRIFCRMLEVEGFRKLERDFYNIKWKRISLDTHKQFLSELGDILLSLRWRVSWWKVLGDGGREPDPSQQHYVERVELLCRILYVYYTNVRAKLPSWSTAQIPDGTWSTYADVERSVWDDFPLDATENGFLQWMERGRALIAEAGVPSRVSTRITKV